MKFIKGNLTYVLVIGIIAIQIANTLGDDPPATGPLATDPPATDPPAKTAIKCVQCGTGTACPTDIKTPTPTDCDSKDAEQCFTKYDTEGKVTRGCLLPTDNTCTDANNCVPTAAEKNNQLICKICDTTDASCSQTDMKDNAVKYNKICADGVTQCIMNVKDKKVYRGCASAAENTACTDATTCNVCDSINCNVGIFPTKRINCYQCSDATCDDYTKSASKPCLNYVDKDQCYTKGESTTTMKRGCQSDDASNDCTDSTKAGCQFCSADQCNNLSYERDPKRKCHQCSGADCYKEQTTAELKSCEKKLLYTDAEYCYTNVNGGAVQRGCLKDSTDLTVETCKDDTVCTKCSDADGCNSKAVTIEFSCIVCRSDLDSKCWNHAKELQGSKCRTGTSTPDEGCFHGIWNGVAIRGCYIDANDQQKAICKDKDNYQCNWCSGTNCNTEDSSGASTNTMYFGLWLMILTTLWYFK